MHEEVKIRQILIAAMVAACGVMVPILFHLLGLGSIFLPMFIPLATGSFFLSPHFAFFTGAVVPLASSFLTGMPPIYPPIAIIMSAELAVFCLLISLLLHHTRMHSLLIICIAIFVDRLFLLCLVALIMPAFHISAKLFSAYDILKSLPGVLLLIVITPATVEGIHKIFSKTTLG